MDEHLDNRLKKRIEAVFDHIEDPSADEGWLKLRERYPKSRRRRMLPWAWPAAAMLLFLFTGLGIWLWVKVPVRSGPVANAIKTIGEHPAAPVAAPPAPPTPIIARADQQNLKDGGRAPVAAAQAGRRAPVKQAISQTPAFTNAYVKKAGNAPLNTRDGKNTGTGVSALAAPAPDSTVHQLAAVHSRASDMRTAATGIQTTVSAPEHPTGKKTMADMFASDSRDAKKTAPGGRLVQLGIFAATYYNYGKGSDNKANVGAGLTADFRISKHLKLETGITLAQNSLNYNTQIPTSTAQNSFAVPAAAASFKTASMLNTASVPAFKNYNASLVSLDIPVNLKYDFNLHQNHVYVLAGLSSGTFTNETYQYRYNYPALPSPSLQQTQNQISTKKFDSFYFAKMLNLGVGFGYPIGRNTLVLEPFLKYPLDGLGAQYLRFGAGGINLKFDFQFRKNNVR